jgi:hypothetical protein
VPTPAARSRRAFAIKGSALAPTPGLTMGKSRLKSCIMQLSSPNIKPSPASAFPSVRVSDPDGGPGRRRVP